MKDKPILFTGPMVRAILDGRKTMTRRVLTSETAKPRYAGGNRLWVKEMWRPSLIFATSGGGAVVHYAADSTRSELLQPTADWKMPKAALRGNVSPLFMPRWASRITLEVTSHRVERVQDITEEDAIAEGMQEPSLCNLGGVLRQAAWSERQVFSRLWDYIHGKGAWARNDWVEVIGFRRIKL